MGETVVKREQGASFLIPSDKAVVLYRIALQYLYYHRKLVRKAVETARPEEKAVLWRGRPGDYDG